MTEHDESAPRVVDKRGARKATPQSEQPTLPFDEDSERLLAEQAAQARLEDAERAEQEAVIDRPFLTGFLVLINHDGTARATSELTEVSPDELTRPASVADFFSGCHHVTNDVTTSQAAQRVLAVMQRASEVALRQSQAVPVNAHPGPFPPGWRR